MSGKRRVRDYRRDRRLNVPGRRENWRGPNRALAVDEQLEVRRLMHEARTQRKAGTTARDLAARFGVSNRTIYRYAESVPVPAGLENLRIRIQSWAAERAVPLTYDDLQTLLLTVARHRDMAA